MTKNDDQIMENEVVNRTKEEQGADTENKAQADGRNHEEHELNVISIIESLLFVADRPLGVKDLTTALDDRVSTQDVRDAVQTIEGDYSHGDRGIVLMQVAGGWQFRTNPANKHWVQRFLSAKPQRLSRAALETLAIIAYRQPIIRAEIEEIRGVDSSAAIKTLLERGLVKILGRKEEMGRPLIYGTSKEFLEFFGLKDLKDLPALKDLEDLMAEQQDKLALPEQEGEGEAGNELGQGEEQAPGEEETNSDEAGGSDRKQGEREEKGDAGAGSQRPGGEQTGETSGEAPGRDSQERLDEQEEGGGTDKVG